MLFAVRRWNPKTARWVVWRPRRFSQEPDSVCDAVMDGTWIRPRPLPCPGHRAFNCIPYSDGARRSATSKAAVGWVGRLFFTDGEPTEEHPGAGTRGEGQACCSCAFRSYESVVTFSTGFELDPQSTTAFAAELLANGGEARQFLPRGREAQL